MYALSRVAGCVMTPSEVTEIYFCRRGAFQVTHPFRELKSLLSQYAVRTEKEIRTLVFVKRHVCEFGRLSLTIQMSL